MKGITEYTLKRIDTTVLGRESLDLLNGLIDECTELNPWQPIDGNTPKGKVFYDEFELPKDPKE